MGIENQKLQSRVEINDIIIFSVLFNVKSASQSSILKYKYLIYTNIAILYIARQFQLLYGNWIQLYGN